VANRNEIHVPGSTTAMIVAVVLVYGQIPLCRLLRDACDKSLTNPWWGSFGEVIVMEFGLKETFIHSFIYYC